MENLWKSLRKTCVKGVENVKRRNNGKEDIL